MKSICAFIVPSVLQKGRPEFLKSFFCFLIYRRHSFFRYHVGVGGGYIGEQTHSPLSRLYSGSWLRNWHMLWELRKWRSYLVAKKRKLQRRLQKGGDTLHMRDFSRGNTMCRVIEVEMAESFGEEQVSLTASDVWLEHKLKLNLTELYNNHKYLSFSLLSWGTSEEFWIRESQVSVVLGSCIKDGLNVEKGGL